MIGPLCHLIPKINISPVQSIELPIKKFWQMAGVVPSSSIWPKTYLLFRGWLTISNTLILTSKTTNLTKNGRSTKLGCFITYQSYYYLLTPPIVEITLFEIPATLCIRVLDKLNLIWQIAFRLEPSFITALADSKIQLSSNVVKMTQKYPSHFFYQG